MFLLELKIVSKINMVFVVENLNRQFKFWLIGWYYGRLFDFFFVILYYISYNCKYYSNL